MSLQSVGLFDSGLGGLGLLREFMEFFPEVSYHYLCDREYAPYGKLAGGLIEERCLVLTERLLESGVEGLVVACNTATAFGIESIRQKFSIPVVGIEPYLNYLHHGPRQMKAVVITTEATSVSSKFIDLKERFDPSDNLKYLQAPGLAEAIEERLWGDIDDRELCLRVDSILKELSYGEYSHAILGCTHYPLIADMIASKYRLTTVCPSQAVVRHSAKVFGWNLPNVERTPALSFDDIKQNEFSFAASPEKPFYRLKMAQLLG